MWKGISLLGSRLLEGRVGPTWGCQSPTADGYFLPHHVEVECVGLGLWANHNISMTVHLEGAHLIRCSFKDNFFFRLNVGMAM